MTKPAEQFDLFSEGAPPARPAQSPLAPAPRSPRGGSELQASVAMPRPTELPEGTRWHTVQTPSQAIGFLLRRSRRRSIGFVVSDEGLIVTAPTWVSQRQIDDAVVEKARWILSKTRQWQDRREQLALASTQWHDGGELPYLGKRIVLKLTPETRLIRLDGDVSAPQEGNALWLPLPAGADTTRIRDTTQAWLQQRAADWFGQRLAHFLHSTGLTIHRWRLSSAATRWGSCSADGNIMLNWRLIHFAPPVIDYVIAHELAHLRQMNHSPAFWKEVGNILPDFHAARDALRRYDPSALPLL